jgi:hypothetical protein
MHEQWNESRQLRIDMAESCRMSEKDQQGKSAFPEQCRIEAQRMLADSEPAPMDAPGFARRMAEIIRRALRTYARKPREPRY